MIKIKSVSLLLILSLVLCMSAKGQEPMTSKQIREVNKVRKNLAHYETGTKMDVRLRNGSHHIGILSQAGATSFVIVDPVSSRPESIDYLDVKRLKPSGKRQLGKSRSINYPAVDIALIGFALITLLVVR